jgi:MFS family permease
MNVAEPGTPMPHSRRIGLLVLICAIVVVGLAFGTRQSLGLFMRPITLDLGWGRENLSLVFAIQALLNGIAAPFAGAISDRWGTGRTVAGSAVLYAVGLLLMSLTRDPLSMMLGGGLLVGMGISACGMPVMLAAVARVAPEDRRSLWLGLVTGGATAGQLAIIPGTRALLDAQSWSTTLMVLGACFVVLLPMAACLGVAAPALHAPLNDRPVARMRAAAKVP